MARIDRGRRSWIATLTLVVVGTVAGCSDGGVGPAAEDAGSLDATRAMRDALPTDSNLGPCPGAMAPPIPPEALPVCPLCEGARCVPTSFVPEEQRELLANCDEGNECVPDLFVATTGEFLLRTCRSLGNAEGRCISRCIPQVAAQADMLPEADCGPGEECAPCFDPTTGESTGVCDLGCDPGPAEPPTTFEMCCGGIGSCVPADLVPPESASQLGRDTCMDEGTLCAPSDLIDPTARPDRCDSVGGVEGRCLPACLPAIGAQADRLPRSTCEESYLCAPCYDPTNGEDTGACSLNGDMPEDPPTTFDRCCGGIGACVPESLVPEDQRSQLGTDTCEMDGQLCAPDSLVAGDVPTSCRSIGDAEGRCLPSCLPAIAAQADRLPRSTCAEAHLCAPCYDPISGEASGACSLNGDMPAEPPFEFANCCGGIGSCVPSALVPESQRAQLGADTCTGAGELCAPDELSDPGAVPMSCRSIADAEGRCLPSCLPAIAAQASRLPRSSCPATHLCAPCFDPITGEDSGACRLGTNMPVEPPFTFEACCGGIGSCVPPELVPADQRSQLGRDSCSMTSMLCAPDELAADGFRPPMCNSIGGAEGRCLPACLPAIAAQADRLPRDTCAATHLCAPCFDPISGESSGACEFGGDMPSEPPYVFPGCCTRGSDDRGRCVPPEVIPEDRRGALKQDSCAATQLCVPDPFLADPDYSFPTCTTGGLFGGNPGACVPDCMIDALQRLVLARTTCAAGELCAPCINPLGGASTGACD